MRKFCLSLLCMIVTVCTGFAVEPSGTLPVLVIETNNRQPILSKTDYVHGTYYLDPKGVAGVEAIGSAENPLPLEIRGRGNYTWQAFNKKPYRLKLDKKAALLGMESSKHFALLAHADDNRAFMRNITGFEVSRMAGLPWTPADKPCEVVLNGDYIGLYFLTETIRFDKKRINLHNQDDDVEDWLAANPDKTAADYPFTEEDYTGPWLIEIDNYQDDCQVVVPSKQGKDINIQLTYKTPEDYVTDAHRQWLVKEFSEIDGMVYADNNADGKWLEKVDLTDAARFFVVNQIMNNYESYHGSCYLTKDKGTGEKWHFGPVWDFGSAFQPGRDVSLWIWECQYVQHWVKNFWNCEAFRNEVKRIFEDMNKEGFERIFNYQNDYAARISVAAKSDAVRWQNDGYGNPDMKAPLAEVQKQLVDAIKAFGEKLCIEGFEPPAIPPANDIYLRGGEYENWGVVQENRFTDKGNQIYELKVNRLTGEFKLAGPEWNQGNVDYGTEEGKKFILDNVYPLTYYGKNISLASGSADNVYLIFDWRKKELKITNQTGIDILLDSELDGTVFYNLQGIRVERPISGNIYIIRQGNNTRKVVY